MMNVQLNVGTRQMIFTTSERLAYTGKWYLLSLLELTQYRFHQSDWKSFSTVLLIQNVYNRPGKSLLRTNLIDVYSFWRGNSKNMHITRRTVSKLASKGSYNYMFGHY